MSARRFLATKVHNFKDENGKRFRLTPKGLFIRQSFNAHNFYFVTRKEMKRILVTRGHYFLGSVVTPTGAGPTRRFGLAKYNGYLELGCQTLTPQTVAKIKAWAGVE